MGDVVDSEIFELFDFCGIGSYILCEYKNTINFVKGQGVQLAEKISASSLVGSFFVNQRCSVVAQDNAYRLAKSTAGKDAVQSQGEGVARLKSVCKLNEPRGWLRHR